MLASKNNSFRCAITKIIGYTRAIVTSTSSNRRSIFYSHPCYQGEEWYDWAMVHFEETNPFGENIGTFYPLRLLGFITSNGTRRGGDSMFGQSPILGQCTTKLCL